MIQKLIGYLSWRAFCGEKECIFLKILYNKYDTLTVISLYGYNNKKKKEYYTHVTLHFDRFLFNKYIL